MVATKEIDMERGLIQADTAAGQASLGSLSMTDRLNNEKVRLDARLKEVNAAIDALLASPDVALAVDAISKLGHF